MGSHHDSSLTADERQKLEAAVAEVFGAVPPALQPDVRLGNLEGWDSMNSVTFTMELERVFGVDLSGAVLTADQTIADAMALVRDCQTRRAT